MNDEINVFKKALAGAKKSILDSKNNVINNRDNIQTGADVISQESIIDTLKKNKIS